MLRNGVIKGSSAAMVPGPGTNRVARGKGFRHGIRRDAGASTAARSHTHSGYRCAGRSETAAGALRGLSPAAARPDRPVFGANGSPRGFSARSRDREARGCPFGKGSPSGRVGRDCTDRGVWSAAGRCAEAGGCIPAPGAPADWLWSRGRLLLSRDISGKGRAPRRCPDGRQTGENSAARAVEPAITHPPPSSERTLTATGIRRGQARRPSVRSVRAYPRPSGKPTSCRAT